MGKDYLRAKTRVVRITLDDDAGSISGLRKACTHVKHKKTLIWSASPCVGGSAWNFVNKGKPGGMKRFRRHRQEWNRIWKRTEELLLHAAKIGAKVAIEWPSSCQYWKLPKVVRLLTKYNLRKAKCNGCAMGLVGQLGKPVYKPWTVATNCSELFEALNCQKCPGPKAHKHEPCAGKNTKMSENYTETMVRIIHKAWTKHCSTMTLAKTDKIARESKVTGSNHFGLTGTQSTAPPPPAPWPGDHSWQGGDQDFYEARGDSSGQLCTG